MFRFWQRIKDAKMYVVRYHQRGMRGFADCDTWSLDGYLLSWLPEAIQQIREFPAHPEGFTSDEWDEILGRMIAGLECGYQLIDFQYETMNETINLQEEVEIGLDLFREHFFHLWT